MSYSFFLVLDVNGGHAFDVDRLHKCLARMPGVRGLWAPPRLLCQFDFNDDSTEIALVDDQCLSIRGIGDASLQAALEIQRSYGGDVHAVDPESCFEIPLSVVNSLEELRRMIASAS